MELMPFALLTSNSKYAICSSGLAKLNVFLVSPTIEIPLLNFKLSVTFFTLFSIVKTVTGSVTFSPGLNFRGSVAKTINGFLTSTDLSVLPYASFALSPATTIVLTAPI